MSLEIDGLYFRIGAKLDAAFNQTLSEAQRQFAQVADSLQGAGQSLDLIGRHFRDVGSAALKMGGEFQQAQIGFSTMLGSADQATAFLGKLKDFAAKTPFEFPGLVDASKRLMAFGFEANKIIPMLRNVGDAAAALGGGAKSIDLMTLAIGQMGAKGKVSAQEMNQLAEQGVPAWDMLAKKIGVSIPDAMKLAEKGAIQARDAIPAILEGMHERFGGMMQKQSETILGQWSNLKDKFTFILYDLGEAMLPLAKNVIAAFGPVADTIAGALEGFKELPEPVRNAALGFGALAAGIGPLTMGLGMAASAFLNINQALVVMTGQQGLAAASSAMGVLGKATVLAAAAFGTWNLVDWLYTNTAAFKSFADTVSKFFFDIFPQLGKAFDAVINRTSGLASATKTLEGSLRPLEDLLKKKGITIDKTGKSLEQYALEVNKAVRALPDYGKQLASASGEQKKTGDSADDLARKLQEMYKRALQGGTVADTAAKQAAAAMKQLEAHLASAWKSMSAFLMDMPKTFAQAQQMMANGFNIDAAIKRTVDEMQKLRIEFGDKLPPAAQQMYNALEFNRRSLVYFRDEASRLQLEDAFRRANVAIEQVGKNTQAAGAGMQAMMAVVQQAVNNATRETVALDAAFKSLGVTTSTELTAKANGAAEAFKLIQKAYEAGKITVIDFQQATIRNLEVQISVAKASGNAWQQYAAELKIVQAALKASGVEAESSGQKHAAAGKQAVGAASEMQKAWNSFGQQVSTVMTDFSKNLATSILQAKNFGDAFVKAAQAIKEAFLRMVVEGAIKQMMSGLGDVSKMLGGLGQQMNGLLGSIFGGGSSGGGGTGGGGGAGGGGGTGGLGSMMGGGPIGMMSGITSMITGVLQTLQGRRMEADIGKIEVTSRGQLNQLISIQSTMNKYLPLLDHNVQLMRLEGIEQALAIGGGNMMGDLVAALSQALQGVSQTLQQGFQMLAQRLDLLTETMRINLRGLIDITSTAYSMLLKPGSTPQYNLTTQNGRPNAAPPVTVNQTILAQTNDPYRLGVQSVQGMQAAMGFRL